MKLLPAIVNQVQFEYNLNILNEPLLKVLGI